jgi:hypothetical protein
LISEDFSGNLSLAPMNVRNRILVPALTATALVIAIAFAAFRTRTDTTLEFSIRDSVSGKWVWAVAVKLQDRALRGYYQSDSAPVPFRFTRLSPGTATLEIAAENYGPISLPVTLKRGANKLVKPINMVGLDIPDLKRIYLFESWDAGDIATELRPVDSTGKAVLNHPCMDLWIGCRISVQMKDGAPAREESETGSSRGRVLFKDRIAWTWNPAPETQFRYKARIPAAKIAEDPSDYRVVDYLIVVPKPLAIDRAELETLMARVYASDDPLAVAAALDAEKGRLSYFTDTTWNLKARQE